MRRRNIQLDALDRVVAVLFKDNFPLADENVPAVFAVRARNVRVRTFSVRLGIPLDPLAAGFIKVIDRCSHAIEKIVFRTLENVARGVDIIVRIESPNAIKGEAVGTALDIRFSRRGRIARTVAVLLEEFHLLLLFFHLLVKLCHFAVLPVDVLISEYGFDDQISHNSHCSADAGNAHHRLHTDAESLCLFVVVVRFTLFRRQVVFPTCGIRFACRIICNAVQR